MSSESLTSFVTEIIDYAKKNPAIREVSYETVTQLVKNLPWKRWESAAQLRHYLLSEFCNQSLEQLTIEQVGLNVALKDYYYANNQELPSSSSGADSETKHDTGSLAVSSSVRKLVSSKYLPQLHTALFANLQHYPFQDKLHSTWTTLLLHLWRHHSFEKFAQFWKTNIDELLFGGILPHQDQNGQPTKSPTFAKKCVGFHLVSLILQILPEQYELKSVQPEYADSFSLLSTTPLSQVLTLIFQSRNFMRTFINHLSSKKHLLYHQCMLVRKRLLGLARTHPNEILPIVTCLEDASTGGHARFDQRTNTSTVITLLEGLDNSGIEAYVQKLVQLFIHANPAATGTEETEAMSDKASSKKKDKKSATSSPALSAMSAPSVDSADEFQRSLDSVRQFCIDQLFALARNHNLPQPTTQSGSWLHIVLQFFLYYGYFNTEAPSKSAPFPDSLTHPISEKIQLMMQDKLFSLLNDLLPHPPVIKRAEQKPKQDDEDVDMDNEDSTDEYNEASMSSYHSLFSSSGTNIPWPLRIHQDWTNWTSGKKSSSQLLVPLSKEEAEIRNKSPEFVNGLRDRYEKLLSHTKKAGTTTEEEKSQLAQFRSIQLLHLHLSLLLLKAEDRQFAAPLLTEIEEGMATLYDAPKSKSKSKKKVPDSTDQPAFINVLVDILLSLLIRPSNLFRDISRSVFTAFASTVNEEVLQELMEVLRKKEKAPGEEKDDEDEDSDNFPSEEDEEEEEEDDKGKNRKKGNVKESKKGNGAKPSKSNKLSKLDAEAAANAEKYKHLAAGSDDDDDDDEMLDSDGLNKLLDENDESGLANVAGAVDAYDAHLGAIVRLRNEKKLAGKELAQQSLHFKLRVADLVEVFIRTQTKKSLIFELYLPMLVAIDAARGQQDSKPLHQRLVALYKKMVTSKDHPAVTSELSAKIQELQTLLMQRAVKTADRETLHLLNLALMYLTKLIIPTEVKDQVAATSAAIDQTNSSSSSSKKSKSSVASSAHPAVSFVLSLYRNELIRYITVRRSLLNTKFFTDFFQRFPALSWSFVPLLSQLAQVPLPTELTKNTAAHTNEIGHAANPFLRNDCFLLLGGIFTQRHLLKGYDITTRLMNSLPDIQNAISSTVLAVTLPPSSTTLDEPDKLNKAKNDDEEEDDEDKDEDKDEESKEATDGKKEKLSKEERQRLRLRAKKKRREARRKEAARVLAAQNATPEAEEAKTAAAQTRHVHRLKNVLKFANQAALAFNPSDTSTPSPIYTSELAHALTSLPSSIATPLKGSLTTFLISAHVDRNKLKLQIDDSGKNSKSSKPIENKQSQKKTQMNGGDLKTKLTKKRSADSMTTTTTDAKKPKVANKSSPKPTPSPKLQH